MQTSRYASKKERSSGWLVESRSPRFVKMRRDGGAPLHSTMAGYRGCVQRDGAASNSPRADTGCGAIHVFVSFLERRVDCLGSAGGITTTVGISQPHQLPAGQAYSSCHDDNIGRTSRIRYSHPPTAVLVGLGAEIYTTYIHGASRRVAA